MTWLLQPWRLVPWRTLLPSSWPSCQPSRQWRTFQVWPLQHFYYVSLLSLGSKSPSHGEKSIPDKMLLVRWPDLRRSSWCCTARRCQPFGCWFRDRRVKRHLRGRRRGHVRHHRKSRHHGRRGQQSCHPTKQVCMFYKGYFWLKQAFFITQVKSRGKKENAQGKDSTLVEWILPLAKAENLLKKN